MGRRVPIIMNGTFLKISAFVWGLIISFFFFSFLNIAVAASLYISDQVLQYDPVTEIASIKEIQDNLFLVEGKYEQVKDIINVYESPDGWGYQTVQKYSDRVEYTGYGPNAKDYTYIESIPTLSASSTKPGLLIN